MERERHDKNGSHWENGREREREKKGNDGRNRRREIQDEGIGPRN